MNGARRGWVALVLAVLVAACSAEPLVAPPGPAQVTATLPAVASATAEPAGTVTLAYPDEPSSFLGPVGVEPARDDVAALWGLPLFRIDDAGQLRRGLVTDWDAGTDETGTWAVRLTLRPGEWSDGSAVDAADVVATLQARVGEDPARFGVIADVTASDDHTVVVSFDRPYAAWSDLLVEAGSMLPSETVPGAAEAYRDAVPVSGGWFRLVERDPGLRLVFEAHPAGPLGPPALARVEVLLTPSFETALGLLEEGEVDGLLGYLPLNGVSRTSELADVEASSPLGGTLVALQFRPGGLLGGDEAASRRRGVAETVNVDEIVEGMLGPNGEAATSPWPTVPGPSDVPVGEVRENQEFVLMYPAGGEVLGFTARAIQRDLTSRGMTVDLVGVPAPRFGRAVTEERDVALVVRRTSRRPSLAPLVADPELAHAAGAADLEDAAANQGLAAAAEHARVVPLFRTGVLHAWRGVEGVRPSSWLGAGFWNAGEWSTGADG